MKFTKFEKLSYIIAQLGAPPVIANLEKQLLGEGIPVEPNKERIVIGQNGIFHIDPSGILTKVIIHIVDKNINLRYALKIKQHVEKNEFESPDLIKDLHKYHLVNCTTIERAEREGWRKEKYRMSRKHDGTFYYRFIEDNSIVSEQSNQKLLACKNCLKEINNLLNKHYTTSDFDLNNFLSSDLQITHGLPKEGNYSDMCAPNIYQSDWSEISKKYRALIGYQCENPACPFPDLSESIYHQFLHTHHVSQDKSNSNYSNLRALCIYCHSNQANHEQMKSTSDYIRYTNLRNIT